METSDEDSREEGHGDAGTNAGIVAWVVPTRVVVIGASCRAAAQGIRRAGVSRIEARDEFLDADLLEVAQVCAATIAQPGSETQELDAYSGVPLLLCGGMENRPEEVARCEKLGMVCGVSEGMLRSLRDPANWEKWSKRAGIRWPKSLSANDAITLERGIPEEGNWLLKSRASAGGLGVRMVSGRSVGDSATGGERECSGDEYFQEWISGNSIGATFCSYSNGVCLVGIARGLDASEYPGPLPFIYRGNIAPWSLPALANAQLLKFASLVTEETGVRGLWQADFVWQEESLEEGLLWLLEINPRWSASMELHDLAQGQVAEENGKVLVREHLRAVLGDSATSAWGGEMQGRDKQLQSGAEYQGQSVEVGASVVYGKGVVYAPEDLVLNAEVQRRLWECRWDGVSPIGISEIDKGEGFWLADIPSQVGIGPDGLRPDGLRPDGLRIERGMPIVSVLVGGQGERQVLERLQAGRRVVLEWLGTDVR